MIQTSRNLATKQRQVLVLDNFNGVDFSSSPLNVSPSRATASRNLISRYGVNRKRHGWEQFAKLSGEINSITYFNGYLLVHSSTNMYKVDYNGTVSVTQVNSYPLANKRSQGIVFGDKVYFTGCGVFSVWDGATFAKVADNAYIPTTTININAGATDPVVGNLDDVNMVTPLRKNQLVGKDDASGAYWYLDSTADENTPITIVVETFYNSTLGTKTYTVASDSNTVLDANGNNAGAVVRNYSGNKMRLALSFNTKPPIASQSNITVTFSHTVEGYEDIINEMEFGILFGVNGNTNRLFLAGSPTVKNRFYYSELNDGTYISDMSYTECGQNAINGFARMTDSALAVMKEYSLSEPTMYYTSGQTMTDYDAQGNVDSVTAVFPVVAGAIGYANICRFAGGNLAGDSLMLTKDGVVGIVLRDNMSTDVRNARERSRLINEDLTRKNLEEACAVVHDGKYFLFVDGKCYIADSRYRHSVEGDQYGTYNYEWWYWDNVPAVAVATDGDTILFGMEDGSLCMFGNAFVDIKKDYLSIGDLSIDVTTNSIIYNDAVGGSLKKGDTIVFDGKYMTSKIGTFECNDGVIHGDVYGLYNGKSIYITDGTHSYEDATITNLDRANNTFTIEGHILNNGNVDIYEELCGIECNVIDITSTSCKLAKSVGGNEIDLEWFNGHTWTNTATVLYKNNVVVEWYSPIMDLGSNVSSKSIDSITITTEPEVNGAVQFGYNTKDTISMMGAKGVSVFNFGDIDFNDFSFSNGFATSYTKPMHTRNVNYIMFRFKSDTDKECAVNKISVVYKYNTHNEGVR